MNERIKELLSLPKLERLSDWASIGPVQRAALEDFAELIVEECLNLVDRGGEFASRPKLVERIKEHFGVEE